MGTNGKIMNNKVWKEKYDVSSYAALHKKLVTIHGNAKYCSNSDCKSVSPKRYEWSLINDGRDYSLSLEDYRALCPSCHRKYDYTIEIKQKVAAAMYGKTNAAKAILNEKTGVLYASQREAARVLKIKHTTINAMIRGQNPNTLNLVYHDPRRHS